MSDLTDFLLARIADDEAAANVANTGVRWESWNRSWDTEPQRDIAGGGVRLFTVPTMYDEHVARHDPLRVKRECEAKRRIVEKAQRADAAFARQINPATSAASFAMTEVLTFLALPYADHADYDESWRP